MVRFFSIAGVTASLILVGLMVVSASNLEFRFWPPGDRDGRFWTYLGLSGVASVALVVVTVTDRRAFVFSRVWWWYSGAALAALGGVGFIVAMFDLGLEESTGMEGELRTGGWYRYSRNPQIVFLIVLVVGVVLAVDSPYTTLTGAAMVVWFVSMPFAEEPWLREQFGEDYERYLEQVPRFVGVTTIRRLVGEN